MDIDCRGRGDSLEILLGEQYVPLLRVKGLSEEWAKRLCRWVARQFPAMPGSDEEVIVLPPLFLKPSFGRKRVCFYGGSFNPWHRGHLACIDLCPEENILVIPDHNPWKPRWREGNRWDDFVKLCHTLRETTCSVYPGFLYGEENPTVDWLPRSQFSEKSLLVGADNFLLLDRWKDISTLIASLDTIYVVPRGDQDYGEMMERLRGMKSDLEIVILPRHPYEELASSVKRQG